MKNKQSCGLAAAYSRKLLASYTAGRPSRLSRAFVQASSTSRSGTTASRKPLPAIPNPSTSRAHPAVVTKSSNSLSAVPQWLKFDSAEPNASPKPPISLAQTLPYPSNNLSSTRPAPLDVPASPGKEFGDGSVPIKARAQYLYRLGKAYVNFYKTGFKNIWSNYKEYRNINERIGGQPILDVVLYGGSRGVPAISRRDYQLYLRTRHDLKKLIPFSLIFAICGEFTPLVILAFGSAVVPYTCRIPKQQHSDVEKYLERVRIMKEANTASQDARTVNVDGNSSQEQLEQESKAAYALGLSGSLKPLPLGQSLYSRLWTRPRIHARLEELLCDEILIMREGGFERLEVEEISRFAMRAGTMMGKVYEQVHELVVKEDLDNPSTKRKLQNLRAGLDNYVLENLPTGINYLMEVSKPQGKGKWSLADSDRNVIKPATTDTPARV